MGELPDGITKADLEDDRVARQIAEEIKDCDYSFVATLRRWNIHDAHIAEITTQGYPTAADFGMFLSKERLERLFGKMDKREKLSERNRQMLTWFHQWLGDQHVANTWIV
jgi:hypothetical protein